MTYLVLARKWRPRSFDTLIGQDHVVRALTHALSTQRLHHAWLFTGTRGVGKTTLSRILAKSLNCETGITATPCGTCRACTEIDAGRFVDYLELDAASNRGVDEMTQLLEQAVYAPGAGRFKVYMIDEVHMLTGHAFNAMLKTLEEPPPHVKFILATTDPQKIPVTVLSRCLQFNLKQMAAEAIVAHLRSVLEQENIECETPALRLLAQAASGSMRDALSLTDQAIAYSAGHITAEAVQGMLGTIDQRHLLRLLQALAAGGAREVLDVADELAVRGLSYSGALADLAVLLSRIAIEQRVGATLPDDDPMAGEMAALAARLHPDLVQLFYSIAVHSRQELALAPDEYAGFVMACLRMLSVAPPAPADGPRPGGPRPEVLAAPEPQVPDAGPQACSDAGAQAGARPPGASASMPEAPAAPVQAPAEMPAQMPVEISAEVPADVPAHVPRVLPADISEPAPAGEFAAGPQLSPSEPQSGASAQPPEPPDDDIPAWEDEPLADASGFPDIDDAVFDGDEPPSMPDEVRGPAAAFAEPRPRTESPRLRDMNATAWPALAARLPLTGLAAELARQSEWLGVQGDQVRLRVAVRSLAESPGRSRLRTVLSEHFGAVVGLEVEYGQTGEDTAHAVEQARRAARQKEAEQAVQADPLVRTLIDDFGATVVAGSIRAAAAEPKAA